MSKFMSFSASSCVIANRLSSDSSILSSRGYVKLCDVSSWIWTYLKRKTETSTSYKCPIVYLPVPIQSLSPSVEGWRIHDKLHSLVVRHGRRTCSCLLLLDTSRNDVHITSICFRLQHDSIADLRWIARTHDINTFCHVASLFPGLCRFPSRNYHANLMSPSSYVFFACYDTEYTPTLFVSCLYLRYACRTVFARSLLFSLGL